MIILLQKKLAFMLIIQIKSYFQIIFIIKVENLCHGKIWDQCIYSVCSLILHSIIYCNVLLSFIIYSIYYFTNLIEILV